MDRRDDQPVPRVVEQGALQVCITAFVVDVIGNQLHPLRSKAMWQRCASACCPRWCWPSQRSLISNDMRPVATFFSTSPLHEATLVSGVAAGDFLSAAVRTRRRKNAAHVQVPLAAHTQSDAIAEVTVMPRALQRVFNAVIHPDHFGTTPAVSSQAL